MSDLFINGAYGALTYGDAFDLGVAFLHGHDREGPPEAIQRAIQDAHIDIVSAHNWPSLERQFRIQVHGAFVDGSVAYDSSTRILTLSGAEWPSWVMDGTIRIDGLNCDPEQYIDATHVILGAGMGLGADYPAGTPYQLFCAWYPLPPDFVNFTGPMGRYTWAYGQPVPIEELLAFQRHQWSTGNCRYYAVSERPNRPTEKAIFIWPFAAADDALDCTYQRRPRELQRTGRDTSDNQGTLSTVAGSYAVTGSGTAFSDDMAGAIINVGRDASGLPTGRYGLNRYAEQLRIRAVTSATAAIATLPAAATHGSVNYVITDPIDLETCAQPAFLRYVEMHLARWRDVGASADHGGNFERYINVAERALRDAMAAANPSRYCPERRDYPWPMPNLVNPSVWGNAR